ncbi:MAG: nucleotide exchange factor GrpE [Bacteroidota bacterium]|nr:nucleotide exchange factor GrpE [Crocinitomicaceae bacterium]MEC7005161.1 nucleotide exchange factor GrpE [Bacteroidota bacterium]MEC7945591.1 nucleotide exchange factor GrpE [Bacteroidota bacterium]MEC7955227.1 nucleotide exchange factor GrpE [Bacteroidota bacterium]MEC8004694.1 nucleotide exchange factor GrpE [Bacteroidota bacterium]|tara:strand:- start:959 stop:1486 length:528 start_codon:yes stop_codon:yes gene_type:complete
MKTNKKDKTASKSKKNKPEDKEVEKNSSENEIQKEDQDFKEKYIRLYSEYENYRKRTAKEKIDLITNASENVIKELLPILDDFERAIDNNKNVEDASVLKEGFDLIYSKMHKGLVNQGLKPMEANGKDFDSEIHEAITKIPAPNEKLKGKVVDVIEKGYQINEKVIRYAKVVVGE